MRATCAEVQTVKLACPFRCLDCNLVVGPTVTSRGETIERECRKGKGEMRDKGHVTLDDVHPDYRPA